MINPEKSSSNFEYFENHLKSRYLGYKRILMLYSAEHEILNAHTFRLVGWLVVLGLTAL